MFGLKRIVIAEHERGIRLKERSVTGILGPGIYRLWDPRDREAVQIYNLAVPEFEHPQLDTLLQEHADLCTKFFQVIEPGDEQVGLVYKNGRLEGVLPPASRTVYWKGPVEVKVDIVDIGERLRIDKPLAAQLARPRSGTPLSGKLADAVFSIEVADHQTGLLLIDGELKEQLPPGLHAFWRFGRSVKVELVDRRLQAMEVQGQEILTKDKVSLRVNLAANYRVVDAVAARSELGNFHEHLYRALQFGLREAIGTRTLDTLLAGKGELEKSVHEYVVGRAAPYGLQVDSVGIKDVILPGDMKELLNQVVEAEKVAQANIIKRREETAATRSLLNTAKLMEENPTLLRLKELEVLEKVTDKVGSLTVFGGLDGVLTDMVRINVPATRAKR